MVCKVCERRRQLGRERVRKFRLNKENVVLHKIFSVFDSKTASYCAPFFLKARGEAIRSFADTAQGKDTLISTHPEDFTLFELGEYDDSCAKFTLYDTPLSLGVAIELIPRRD